MTSASSLNLGVLTAPPGLLYVCLSLDNGASWYAQTGVPLTAIGADAAAVVTSITPTAVGFNQAFSVSITLRGGESFVPGTTRNDLAILEA